MLVEGVENVFPDLKIYYKSWMPARGKDFLKILHALPNIAPRGQRLEIETVKVVYVMWKLQLEIYKKTQKAGSPTMNAFIHKCAFFGQLPPQLLWLLIALPDYSQCLREMLQYLGHGYFNYLAVSDSKIPKYIIFQTIFIMVYLRPKLLVVYLTLIKLGVWKNLYNIAEL